MDEHSNAQRRRRVRPQQHHSIRHARLLLLVVASVFAIIVNTVSATKAAATATTTDASDAQQVHCWKVLDGSPPIVFATATGTGCAVDIAFPLVSARFAPNESISVFWTARLLAATQTTNDLKMKLPPPKTLTTGADGINTFVQIPESTLRVCSTRDQCDPTIPSLAASKRQSGDFASGSTLFQSVKELQLPTEGTFVLAAQVRVVDDVFPTISYYYAAFSDVTVATPKRRTPVLDKRTTYCRRSAQDALARTIEASQSLTASSSCELGVVVTSPDVVAVNARFSIMWNATLVRDATKDVRLPNPLLPLDVALDSRAVEIVRATLQICKLGALQCDEFSSSNDLEVMMDAIVPASNFTANSALFAVDAAALATTGTFTAFVHVVLSGGSLRRFDGTTYFEVVVTADDVAAQVAALQLQPVTDRAYCYAAVGWANATRAIAMTSVLAVGTGAECPYTTTLTPLRMDIAVGDTIAVSWTVTQQFGTVSTKFPSMNLTTNAIVTIAHAAVVVCAATDVQCSPFVVDPKQQVFAARATNGTDGVMRFSISNVSLATAGSYKLFVHSVLPNGDARRIDTTAFATFEVGAQATGAAAATDSSSSNVGTIVGVIAASIGGLLVVLFAVVLTRRFLARQRRRAPTKEPVFAFRSQSIDSHDRIPTDSRESFASDASGTFMYVKAAPSPSPLDNVRANSLSYDPFARPSFPDLSSADDGNYTFTLPDESELPNVPPSPTTREF